MNRLLPPLTHVGRLMSSSSPVRFNFREAIYSSLPEYMPAQFISLSCAIQRKHPSRTKRRVAAIAY